MRHLILLALLLSLLAVSPSAFAQSVAPADVFISAEDARALVGTRGTVFLHVGTDEAAFHEGHIEGAHFLPLSAVVVERDGVPMELPDIHHLDSLFNGFGMRNNGRVIIYADPSRGDMETLAAARAHFTLDVLGHPHINMIDGGLDAWRRAGLPLSTEGASPADARFEVQDRAKSLIVDADQVAQRLGDDAVILADARPLPQFLGDDPGDGVERPGHIPGAGSLFWKDFLREDGTLKSVRDLGGMWEAIGHEPGDDVIVYCRTGMQASFAYLVAKHLGLRPLMYDGSYIDWSNNTDYPVERGKQ